MIKYNTGFIRTLNSSFFILCLLFITYISIKSFTTLLDLDNIIYCMDRDDNNNNWWNRPQDIHIRAAPADIVRGFNIVNHTVDGVITAGAGSLALRVAGLTSASLPIKAGVFIGTYGTILGIKYLTRGAANVINININR